MKMNINFIQWIIITLTASWTHAMTTVCNKGCATCGSGVGNSDKCTECLQRYRLEEETCVPCPDKCLQCLIDNSCTLCDSPYFGNVYPQCNRTCPINCNSSGCDALNGHCFGCQKGFYGARCEQKCELCIDERCDRYTCTEGCIQGYYLFASSAAYSDCLSCKDNCAVCSNFNNCTSCKAGYVSFREDFDCLDCKMYISNCIKCRYRSGLVVCDACQDGYVRDGNQCIVHACPLGCATDCHNNGTCIGGCKAGYTGEICDKFCSLSCNSCDLFDINKCLTNSCNVNYNSNCMVLNGHETCNTTGFCLNGCLNGFWDITCNRSCSGGCDGNCDRMTGECYKCEHMRYGIFCDKNCSENCLNNDTVNDVCTKDLGNCLHGCKHGFAGTFCTQPTPMPTQDSTSSTNNGLNFNSASMNAEESSNVPVIAGASAGAAVVFLGVVFGLTFYLYRRSKKKNGNKATKSDGENISVKDLSILELTSGIVNTSSSTVPIGTHDYIYAQPNKARKSQTSKADSLNNSSNDGSTDLQEDRRQDEETDISKDIALEELDEGMPNNEPDIIPTSDTYYNMASLKRSRIVVTELNDYIKGKTDFAAEFEKLPSGLTRTCNEALKSSNRSKNRYNKIYPYDATRVVLSNKKFINASFIDGHDTSPEYIASLGPVKSAMPEFATFWEMVWQENSRKIVMLTNLMESEKMKCEQYWPNEGSLEIYGTVSVKTIAEHIYAEFVAREFQVTKTGETREIIQYHYTAWPDKTVPDTVVSLLEFRDIVEKRSFQNAGPMVVHCSAGIGRTGTYIALDTLIKEGKEDNSVDIFGCVMALRGQRVNMVQNVEQYIFLHHCVAYALTCDPKPMDISSIIHTMTDDTILRQFQNLTNLPMLPNKESDTIAANRHRKDNRKGADIPGDLHRVKLRLTIHDYVNAVYLNGYRQMNKYIIAQTPMANILEDFVSMLYQEDVECIISLDDGKIHDKNVGQFIPPANKTTKCGHFQIQCKGSSTDNGVMMRQLQISRIGSPPNKEKNIKQFQMHVWNSDLNLPESKSDCLHLLDSLSNYSRSGKGKILVHCLDGATRSGMFCAIAIMLEKLAIEKEVSVINTVCQVRGRRRTAVREYDQFRFCYSCIQEHLEIAESKTYYNVL